MDESTNIDDNPFWINPCGFVDEPDSETYIKEIPFDRTFIKESFRAAQISVKGAIRDVNNLKEYMNRVFPSIDMDSFGEHPLFNFLKFPEAELDSSNSISNLPIAYNCIQRHAVVLEQMMIEAMNDEYLNHLRENKKYMVEVLCSLHLLVINLHLRKFRDVTRAVMPEELKNKSSSVQIMRDAFVVKRYSDLMHFLINTLSYCEMILKL